MGLILDQAKKSPSEEGYPLHLLKGTELAAQLSQALFPKLTVFEFGEVSAKRHIGNPSDLFPKFNLSDFNLGLADLANFPFVHLKPSFALSRSPEYSVSHRTRFDKRESEKYFEVLKWAS